MRVARGQGAAKAPQAQVTREEVIGNRQGGVYHLPSGCPSYGQVCEKNQMVRLRIGGNKGGFRKAGNCEWVSLRRAGPTLDRGRVPPGFQMAERGT
jgi:hypothetical protein